MSVTHAHPSPDPILLRHHGLANPCWIATTGLAHVWRVQRKGVDAALKVYHTADKNNEAAGFRLLQHLNGHSAVRVYYASTGVAVMEWASGPSLGDLARGGDDLGAAQVLVETAAKIHAASANASLGFDSLDQWFEPLFNLALRPEWSAKQRHDLAQGQVIARAALAAQTDIRPLHGDLHHDNILMSARGPLAIDAKGLLGDRAFDLANAFSNPVGAIALVHDPRRIMRMGAVFALGIDVPRMRLLRWAVAKCALSIAWNAANGPVDPAEFELLAIMLKVVHPSSL